MEGRLLARARAKQETLRAENRAEEDRRRREIAAKIPEIGRIDTALCANLSEMVRIAMRQSARTAQELEKESLALQEKRSALLVQNGYPKDYLDPIYSCPRCRDTGWTDGKICECVQKLYRAEQTRELAPLLKQGDETFENFRLDYYSPVAPASGVSPRAQMERVLRLCRAYAESFGAQSPNLLFTGEPGLGKTFLSAAIARVVAAKGCGVAYDTASGLLASFEREKFSRDTDEVSDAASRVRQLMSCDLLILDDLGTEMPTAFTQSALYALLDGYNVRILSGHSHNNYTTTISETIEENTLGAVMGAYWNGEELCNDGSPRGYAVYEIEGNRIANWYGPGQAVSEQYRDGLIFNIFNWHSTWTVEVREDDAAWTTLPSGSNLKYEMDRRAYDFMYGDTKPEHRPTAEPETNNDHMFYYEPSSATWSEVTVKASDPYGNVYTESIRNE